MARTGTDKKSGRRRWFSLHSWVGLKLSLLLFFVSLTGTLAVYAYEIDWLFTPGMRVDAPAGAEHQPVGTLIAAAIQYRPDWTPTYLYANPPGYMAAEVLANDEEGGLQRLYINPYTGEVQGTAGWFNVHRFLRQAHRHLMLPLQWGITIVSLLSIPLLLSMISAFPIFKRWWKGFSKIPKKGAPPRRWWGDLHRWLGVWSLPFILVIGLTGLWYLVERWGGSAPSSAGALVQIPETRAMPTDADTLNRNLERALAQWPGYRVDSVRFLGDNKPLIIQGQDRALLVRPRANLLLVDPASGDILDRLRGEQLSAHQRIAEAADPLHFGTFGGQFTRFLWFVFGAMLCLLSASGVWIYALRLCGAPGKRRPSGDAPQSARRPQRPRSRWGVIWRGQTLGWLQAGLIAACFVLTGLALWS